MLRRSLLTGSLATVSVLGAPAPEKQKPLILEPYNSLIDLGQELYYSLTGNDGVYQDWVINPHIKGLLESNGFRGTEAPKVDGYYPHYAVEWKKVVANHTPCYCIQTRVLKTFSMGFYNETHQEYRVGAVAWMSEMSLTYLGNSDLVTSLKEDLNDQFHKFLSVWKKVPVLTPSK
jgi:hypothetical protein